MSNDNKITYDRVLTCIKETGVPYDPGFDTEEHMVASFKAGLMLASKMVRALGNQGLGDTLEEAADIKDEYDESS